MNLEVKPLSLDVEPPPASDVVKALNQTGLSVHTAQPLSPDSTVTPMTLDQEVEGVDQKELTKLLALLGGKTTEGTGA